MIFIHVDENFSSSEQTIEIKTNKNVSKKFPQMWQSKLMDVSKYLQQCPLKSHSLQAQRCVAFDNISSSSFQRSHSKVPNRKKVNLYSNRK